MKSACAAEGGSCTDFPGLLHSSFWWNFLARKPKRVSRFIWFLYFMKGCCFHAPTLGDLSVHVQRSHVHAHAGWGGTRRVQLHIRENLKLSRLSIIRSDPVRFGISFELLQGLADICFEREKCHWTSNVLQTCARVWTCLHIIYYTLYIYTHIIYLFMVHGRTEDIFHK